MQIMKIITVVICSYCVATSAAYSAELPVSLFPISNYDQKINRWIKPSRHNYNRRLLSAAYQKARMHEMYRRVFADDDLQSSSPWSKQYINKLLLHKPSLLSLEKNLIDWFGAKVGSEKYTGYGENFHRHKLPWILRIKGVINWTGFSTRHYQAKNLAIAVSNLTARLLPTETRISIIIVSRGKVILSIICKSHPFGLAHPFMFWRVARIKHGLLC